MQHNSLRTQCHIALSGHQHCFNSCPWLANRIMGLGFVRLAEPARLVGLRAAVGRKVKIGHDREAATYLPTSLPTYHASPFSDKPLRAATKDRFVRANIRYDPTEPSRTRTFLKQADIWRLPLPLLQRLPRPSLAEMVSSSIIPRAEPLLKATEIANGFAIAMYRN